MYHEETSHTDGKTYVYYFTCMKLKIICSLYSFEKKNKSILAPNEGSSYPMIL